MSLIGTVLRALTERQARGKSYTDFQRALEKTGTTVLERFHASTDTPAHRQAGRHITGIEAWSQSRLRVALGAALQMDEYDGYAPDETHNMAALADTFARVRAGTVQLAIELESAGVPLTRTVPHNDLGDLSIAGWLSYIIAHAGRESRRL